MSAGRDPLKGGTFGHFGADGTLPLARHALRGNAGVVPAMAVERGRKEFLTSNDKFSEAFLLRLARSLRELAEFREPQS